MNREKTMMETREILLGHLVRLDTTRELLTTLAGTSFESEMIRYVSQFIDILRSMVQFSHDRDAAIIETQDAYLTLQDRMDQEAKKITDTLELILQWKKENQPILDEARDYFEGMAEKIGKRRT